MCASRPKVPNVKTGNVSLIFSSRKDAKAQRIIIKRVYLEGQDELVVGAASSREIK
jgi:hypothetical protein